MSYEDIVALLPTTKQKWTILALGAAGIALVIWMVWKRRMREEHALMWFIGITGGVALVWTDPVLARLSYFLGIDTPASALVLASIFFLACLSMWFTSVASRNKHRIEQLIIHVSLLESALAELRAGQTSGGTDTP